MDASTGLSEPKTARQIGAWGTLSRVLLSGVFIVLALSQGIRLSDAAIGLVGFPAAVSVAMALRENERLHCAGMASPGTA